MELRHLRYFVAIAEEGSLTKAALRLGIQQPPLGQQLRDLEYHLGVDLFDRSPKKLTLNAAGRIFLKDAREILDKAQTAVSYIRRFKRGDVGSLRIGFTSSASLNQISPRILGDFRAKFPAAELMIEEAETYELVLALRDGRADVVFFHVSTERYHDLVSVPLTEEKMVVALPKRHPHSEHQGPFDLRMLDGEDMIVYHRSDGMGIYTGILKILANLGVRAKISDQVNRMIAALNLVAAGRGITIVPASMTMVHNAKVIYLPIDEAQLPPLPLYISYRRDERLPLVQSFVASTIQTAGGNPT